LNSLIKFMSGIMSHKDSKRATYSASYDDRVMIICNLDVHAIGQPAYKMT
jgi:hypothetical protein